ncbi:MAG: GNAT family N-acetyltransferase [Eubacterium sp.]
MIEKINCINDFDGYGITDIYSIRIKSLLTAYGCKYDFASFYRQLSADKKITAVISRLDNDFTLSFNNDCNNDELAEFFSLSGYDSVLCDEAFTLTDSFDSGYVMVTDKKKEIHKPGISINYYPKLMDIFNLVNYEKTEFDSWYVDVSHRIRHNCAKAASVEIDGITVSSGVFSSIYNDDAILTSVQTMPEFQNRGYASALVSEMICDIKGRVFLMREENRNENFYKNLGFINCGRWRSYR